MNTASLVSNPPYNMKWTLPPEEATSFRFSQCEIPPENNANFAFILTGLAKVSGRAVFLLPNGVLTTANAKELAIKKYLIDSGLISAVVALPEKMFESTSIPVCLVVFDKQNTASNVVFVDLRQQCETEERKQRGQYGNASHTNRTYVKKVAVISDVIRDQVVRLLDERGDMPTFAALVSCSDIAANGYNLSPSCYISDDTERVKHRNLEDIVEDLNRIVTLRNILKLVMNVTIAERMGFSELAELQKKSNECTAELQGFVEKITGKRLVESDYFTLTKIGTN